MSKRSFHQNTGRPRSDRVGDAGRWAGRASLTIVLLVAGSCGSPTLPYPESLQSIEPKERIHAIKHAGETGDENVVGLLVDRLEDEDPAVRFYAILALERITGTRHGYDYHASESERRRAVQRWRRHLADHESDLTIETTRDGLAAGQGAER